MSSKVDRRAQLAAGSGLAGLVISRFALGVAAIGLVGCSSHAPEGAPRAFGPMASSLASQPAVKPVGTPPEPINLSADDAVVQTTGEPQIIDTRTFAKQIQVVGPWKGEIRDIEEMLGEHGEDNMRRTPQGVANDLPVGAIDETLARPRPGPLFPGITQTPWVPPDPTLAVGPNHIVTTVNTALAFYKKDGTLEFSANLDDSGDPGFFETVGAGGFTFDPKCFYDHLAHRFVIVAVELYGTTESWVDIAVSDDDDPNGVWFKYRTNSVVSVGADTFWVDYPGFGYDKDAYYITGNLFGLNNDGFGGVFYRVFKKSSVIAGGAATIFSLRDANGASCQATQHFGANAAPFFVEVLDTTTLKVSAIKTPITTPTRVSTNVSIPAFSYPSGATPNVGGDLQTVDERIFNVHWRDGNLYAAHTVRSNNKDIARWYHMRTNTWPTSGVVSLVESGNINPASPAGLHTYFPAIYSDKNNNVGVVMGASTKTTTPSIRITGRRPTDPLGTLSPLTVVKTGPNGAAGRWGDYFDLAMDPVDDITFWYIGEIQTPDGWATEIGRFKSNCLSDFNGDGFVTGDDYDAYVFAFEAGDPSADANEDGFVTGDDFDMYVQAFANGC